jgi:hypothetical protein
MKNPVEPDLRLKQSRGENKNENESETRACNHFAILPFSVA